MYKTILSTAIIVAAAIVSCSSKSDTNNRGLLGNFFGKKQLTGDTTHFDTTQLVKTAEMMDEDLYWSLISQSLKHATGQQEQEQFLISEIAKLTPAQIIGFRLRTDKLLYDTYNSEMWCAAYIMNMGCSDDGFEYFRNWVISLGKETYYKAKTNPDNLVSEVKGEEGAFYEFELFWYVALKAFEQKTGRDLFKYVDFDKFKTHEGNYPKFEFNWKEDNPESMKKICPKLFEKVMGQ